MFSWHYMSNFLFIQTIKILRIIPSIPVKNLLSHQSEISHTLKGLYYELIAEGQVN